MKTEITLTIDPMDPNQVAAALALFQKLSIGTNPAVPTAPTGTVVAETKPAPVKKEKAVKAEVQKTGEVTTEAPAETKEVITQVEIKIEEVRALLSKKVGNHREAIKAQLTALGAPNVSTLDSSKYGEFKTFLTSLS